MFQKALALLLVLLTVLSMTGCGSAAPETAPTAATTAAAEIPETTEAPTEPTLSAEEILIASLPEKVRQAYDLGLVELDLLEDLDRICLGAEAAQIIQNIHVAHHGVGSKIMNQLLEHEHANLEVNRYWLAQAMFVAEAEFIEEAPYEDFLENVEYMLKAHDKASGHNELWAYFANSDGWVLHTNVEDSSKSDSLLAYGWDFMPDFEEVYWTRKLADQQEVYVNCTDNFPAAVFWAIQAYDRLSGEKIITANMDTPFLPREKMTVQVICTPFTGHPVEGVFSCGIHMSTKGNV